MGIGGSFWGLLLIANQIIAGAVTGLGLAFTLPFVVFYAWGIWCGIALIESAPRAIRRARWFWTLQIPVFFSPFISFVLIAGAGFVVGGNITGLRAFVEYHVGSQFRFDINRGAEWALGVNLVALAIALLLWRAERRSAAESPPSPSSSTRSDSEP